MPQFQSSMIQVVLEISSSDSLPVTEHCLSTLRIGHRLPTARLPTQAMVLDRSMFILLIMMKFFVVIRLTRNLGLNTQPWNANRWKARMLYRLLPPSMLSLFITIEPNLSTFLNCRYWKKILNYIFGGFNFLMWIAFIVTIVRLTADFGEGNTVPFRRLAVL